MNQQGFAALNLTTSHQADIRCQVSGGECSRGGEVNAGRDRPDPVLCEMAELCEAPRQVSANDPVTLSKPAHGLTDRDHFAGALAADDEGRFGTEMVTALSHQDVGKVGSGGTHLETNLLRAQGWKLQLFDCKPVKIFGQGAADKGSHATSPELMVGKALIPPMNKAVAKRVASSVSARSRRSMRSAISKATPTIAAIR